MSNIIPLGAGNKLPAYLKPGVVNLDINKDVVTTAPYPSISIKGKRWTLVRDGVKEVLMNPNSPEEVAQSIEIAVIRANPHARVFYLKKYDPANSDGMVPDCYSMDGEAPGRGASVKQAEKCAICPRNVWGARDGVGKECNDQIRLAVAQPDKLDDPYLLRVPPASIKPFKEVVKIAKSRNLPYNALVLRVGFDIEAESPKLTFRPVGLLSDEGYAATQELYDSELVHAIIGMIDDTQARTPAVAASDSETAELDAAIAAKAAAKTTSKPLVVDESDMPDLDAMVGRKPAAEPAAEPAKAAAKPKAKAAAKPAPEPDADDAPPAPSAAAAGDLLAGLDSMMGAFDD